MPASLFHAGCSLVPVKSFSITIFPFALFLLIGGQYIADVATLTTAPYTGIILFGVGMIMLAIAMLAFVGSALEYRKLLTVCSALSTILGTILLSVSGAYYVNASGIDQSIADNWTAIRVVLPPTLQARYDRDRFVAFAKANLKALAYVGTLIGCALLVEANLCLTLAKCTSVLKRQLASDKQSAKMSESVTSAESESVIVYDTPGQRRLEVSPQDLHRIVD